MHIPEDGPMRLHDCATGMREAAAHWAHWAPPSPALPGRGRIGDGSLFRVFTCTSWMLDPEYTHT